MNPLEKVNVPRVRFSEFKRDWRDVKVSDFVQSLDAGVSVNSVDRAAKSTEYGVLKTSAVTNGVFNPSENKAVLAYEERRRLREPVRAGTIIISRMNTPALVGANAYVEAGGQKLFLPDRLWAAKSKDGAVLRFLASFLGSKRGRKALSQAAKGSSGSMKNITKADVLSICFSAPSNEEQEKIAEHLRALEKLVLLNQQKREKLAALKKAMLEKFFPRPGAKVPELRFKGFVDSWVERPIGDVLSEVRRPISLEDDRTYELVVVKRRNQGVVSRGTLLGRNILVKNYCQIKEGDFLISKRQVAHGATGVVPKNLDGAIVSNEYLVASSNSIVTTEFFAIVSSLPEMRRKLFISSYGVDIEKLFFDVVDWKRRTIALPHISEQKKICEYFRSLDDLFDLHTAQINKLQQIKSAFLGAMFA